MPGAEIRPYGEGGSARLGYTLRSFGCNLTVFVGVRFDFRGDDPPGWC